jgi:hypothetical protein
LFGTIINPTNINENENWLITAKEFLHLLKEEASRNPKSGAANSLIDLGQMASSIREHGVLQPILVRFNETEERYIVTDGHRRVLATLLAENTRIEAKLKRNWSDQDILAEQLIANLQRKDLTALELARAISQLRSLYSEQIKVQEPKLHPHQLSARVWDKLEASMGIGRRQLQRLMQINELLDNLEPAVIDNVADLKERQFRPFFRLPREEQPAALVLAALNKFRPLQDFEQLVERCLNGEPLYETAASMEFLLPQDYVENQAAANLPPMERPRKIARNELAGNQEEEYLDYDISKIRNVLAALKRLPRYPDPLFSRLEEELQYASESERKKKLYRIEEIEQEALKLSRRLAEIRKKYSQK